MNTLTALDHNERDARLETALRLLKVPVRKAPSPFMPLLASSGLAGAALLLAYTMVIGPSFKSAPAPAAGFEISAHDSGTSQIKAKSAAVPVQEAVMVGSESSR